MIISIGGTMGSGKSTLAKALAKELNIPRFYMGQIFRDLAKKRNLKLREYLELGETDPQIDKEVDDYQTELGKTRDDFIIEGRTSFYFIPQSIKLYIHASPRIAAERIFKDLKTNAENRNEGNFQSAQAVQADIEKRLKSDTKRYWQYYNIDVFNPKNYDLAIDTSNLNPDEVLEKALNYIKNLKMHKSKPQVDKGR